MPARRGRRAGLVLARAGALGAVAATVHTRANLARLRVPPPAREPGARVSVLLPVRDEADRVGPCLAAVLRSRGVADLEVLIYDDGSADATAQVVRDLAGADPRVRLLAGEELPAGWLGKPHACARLAAAATGEVLVFLDADVVLAADGLSRAVAALGDLDGLDGLDLVCPYPRQVADGVGARLVQPLLQWSWLTFLPLGLAERSPRPSLSAANGQLLAVRAEAYRASGGHAAVRAEVLEDLALARLFKHAGLRVAMADGTELASCRMYESWAQLRAGYTKSLWSAFGPAPAAALTLGGLALLYVVPPAALLGRRDPWLAAGTAAGVAGRAMVAARVGGRVWPDSLAHPVSVLALGWLTACSHVARRRGTLSWKGRTLR